MKSTLGYISTVALLAVSAHAQTLITDVQSGIMGLEDSVFGNGNTDTGARYVNAGTWANLVDGDNTTTADNFAAAIGNSGDEGWMGLRFNTAQNNVTSIQIDFQIFVDGGWFNGGEGQEPIVQYTTADISGWTDTQDTSGFEENIWVNIGSSTDYIEGLNVAKSTDAALAGVADGQTFSWNFAPINGVTGLRVLGDVGGSVSRLGGFIAAEEIRAYAVPEPGTYALLAGLSALVYVMAPRRRT